jgi:hypothetical protein
MPKAIMPEDGFGPEFAFSDDRWARIKSHLPNRLPADADKRLRITIAECRDWFLTQQVQLKEGMRSAMAARRRHKQLAPLERLAKGLRMAVDAWASIGRIRDDRCGLLDDRRGLYKTLELMARGAEDRLARKPVKVPKPFPVLVRKVARCIETAGLDPIVAGRVYVDKPTWFQEFIVALDKELLGSKNLLTFDKRKGEQFERDPRATYAAVARAMSGYKKAGKARK